MSQSKTDVCLLLEGTYPYVEGGVSSWTHELISKQDHLKFHIVSILPRDASATPKYKLPANVSGITNIHLQRLPDGVADLRQYGNSICKQLKHPLMSINTKGGFSDFSAIINLLRPVKHKVGSRVLLDGIDTWNLMVEMYERMFAESSFLDYFWSWRALMGGLYSLMLTPLPEAKVYHTLSTGYAGVLAALAKIETGKPALLTEHGIYTNERRIEVASADWLEETASKVLTIDKTRSNLRDLWIDTFTSYSRICYEACDEVITLFEGNQQAQISDGADPKKMRIIPNGVDIDRFSAIPKINSMNPIIGLIGRVVPIKDIKNYIRACAILREHMPDLKAYVIGPTDEDPEYYHECLSMVDHLGLSKTVIFTGKANVDEYYAQLDVLVLTSISEAQPLVILEAGACGIPTVATDVGACRELIVGKAEEEPYLGEGGIITPLSSPNETAESIYSLLANPAYYQQCSKAARERVSKYYNKQDQYTSYRDLYGKYM